MSHWENCREDCQCELHDAAAATLPSRCIESRRTVILPADSTSPAITLPAVTSPAVTLPPSSETDGTAPVSETEPASVSEVAATTVCLPVVDTHSLPIPGLCDTELRG